MNRRDFLAASLVTTGLMTAPALFTDAASLPAEMTQEKTVEYYELRQYHLRRGPQVKRADEYLRDAFLPAMKRLGIGPIGFFNVVTGPDSPTIYALLPCKSVETLVTATAHLSADEEYQRIAAPFVGAPASDPPYIRVESSLFSAFTSVPSLEVPTLAAGNKPRLFELRTYESHSKRANRKKIEMFDKGEIAIFRRAGLQPVFFGEAIIGSRLPNLTYMLVYEDMNARDKNWATFAVDPEWRKLSGTPGYTDAEIVTNISSQFLRPTPYSEI